MDMDVIVSWVFIVGGLGTLAAMPIIFSIQNRKKSTKNG